MKRLLLAIAVSASVAGPIVLSATEASAQDRGRWSQHDREWRRDRDHGHWERRDRWSHHDRWDRGRHNGYYYNRRWHYGPPPTAYYGRPGYRPGYEAWRRGAYLPSYYRGRGYVVNDYYRYHLRPPPRGYYWYRTGNDYVLAAIATGLIFEVIANR